jgi:hypothetical protein
MRGPPQKSQKANGPMLTLYDELKLVIEPQVRPYCGPLFFARSLESAVGNVPATGSFGLLDTGKKKLLVTCRHVWHTFQRARREDANLRILVCLDQNPPVVLGTPPIDQDEALDLATFDMEPLLAACSGRIFFRLNQISPHRLEEGDKLFFLGYPGCFRSVSEEGLQFGRAAYALNVTGVDGPRFYSDISSAKTLDSQVPKTVAQDDRHRGISGSPCFVVRQNTPVQLVGFTTSLFMGHLWFTHARCLNSDGTINRKPTLT